MVSPVKERVLIQRLRKFGFVGPIEGGRKGNRKGSKHPQMVKGEKVVVIPRHHGSKHNEVSARFVRYLLRQAEIPFEDWDAKA